MRLALVAVVLAGLLVGGGLAASAIDNGVTATLSPEEPDGRNDFYTSPVTVTFSGPDGSWSCNPASVVYGDDSDEPNVRGKTIETRCSTDDPYTEPSELRGESREFNYDDAGPTVTGASPASVEGNVLGGYRASSPLVAYDLMTGADDLTEGPIPAACSPGQNDLFPVGSTTVECTAEDSAGNEGTGSHDVTVTDGTGPDIGVVPSDITVQAEDIDAGTPATNDCIQEFLAAAKATDLVEGDVPVTHDAPAQFPVRKTVVTFTAQDSRDNLATPRSATVTVKWGHEGACNIDARPPRNVSQVRTRAGNRRVVLRWQNPGAPDLARIQVYRNRSARPGVGALVYNRLGEAFRDVGLRNGVEYRYAIYAVDRTGNRPPGVGRLATPHRILLLRPRDDAVIRRPPLFDWVKKARARYYNLQLHRMVNGDLKQVLSRWPSASSFRLTKTWRFEGRRYRFVPGSYSWYVYPGFGPRSDSNYGDLMGSNSFRVKRR